MKMYKLPDVSLRCREDRCPSLIAKDGYCRNHWDFYFKGMTNRQRMAEKKNLREMRREREKANVSR